MKNSSLVKLSLATVVAAVALSITPNEDSHASASWNTILHQIDGYRCSYCGGNCPPTVIVRAPKR